MSDGSTGSSNALEPDRFLRTRGNTLAARAARVSLGCERSLPTVRPDLESREQRQRREQFVSHATDLEHVIRANDHALCLSFAAARIDNRTKGSRLLFAFVHGRRALKRSVPRG